MPNWERIHKGTSPPKKITYVFPNELPNWKRILKGKNWKNGKKVGVLYYGGGLLIFSGSWRTLFWVGLLIPCWHYIYSFYSKPPAQAVDSRHTYQTACTFLLCALWTLPVSTRRLGKLGLDSVEAVSNWSRNVDFTLSSPQLKECLPLPFGGFMNLEQVRLPLSPSRYIYIYISVCFFGLPRSLSTHKPPTQWCRRFPAGRCRSHGAGDLWHWWNFVCLEGIASAVEWTLPFQPFGCDVRILCHGKEVLQWPIRWEMGWDISLSLYIYIYIIIYCYHIMI